MTDSRTIRFKSLTNPEKVGYLWEDEFHGNGNGFFRSPSIYLHPWLNKFETYGDSNVQHSSSWAVGIEQALDCLSSLARHLLDNPGDVPDVSSRWPEKTEDNSETIKFFEKLKYDPDKSRQYYNPRELKVSRAESRRHDKRWEEVHREADGGLWSVFCFMVKSHWGFCERFQLFRVVRRALDFP